MKRIIMPLIVTLLFAASVRAQEFKVPVQVEHRGTDGVGLRAAYALKENIRKSHRMALVTNMQPRIRVLLLSVDSDMRDDANYTSAIGTAIVFDSPSVPAGGVFLAFVVNVVGAERGTLFADSLIGHIDEEIEGFAVTGRNCTCNCNNTESTCFELVWPQQATSGHDHAGIGDAAADIAAIL